MNPISSSSPQLPDYIAPSDQQIATDYGQAAMGHLAASLGFGRPSGSENDPNAPAPGPIAPASGSVQPSSNAGTVEVKVVDFFALGEENTFADGNVGSHGGQCAYVVDQSSTASSTQVSTLDIGDFQGKPFTWQTFLPKLDAIAASANPPKVISMSLGMSPAEIFMIKKEFFDKEFKQAHGQYSWDDATQALYQRGLQDLVNQGSEQFNAEWGQVTEQVKQTLTKLVDAGVTVTLASGNAGEAQATIEQYGLTVPKEFGNGIFPSELPAGVILVGASQANAADAKAAVFSSYASGIDVAADGTDLTVSTNGSLYNGTSYAAPQVAGLIADMLAVDPKLKPAEIENILKASAWAVSGQENQVGAGVINRDKALEMAANPASRTQYGADAPAAPPAPAPAPEADPSPAAPAAPTPASSDVATALKAAGMTDADVGTFAPTVVGFEVDPANNRPGWPTGGPSFLDILKQKLSEGVPAGDAILWARFSGLATDAELSDPQFIKDLANAGPNGYGDTAWDSIKFARANQLTRSLSLSSNQEPLALSLPDISRLLLIQAQVVKQLQDQGKPLSDIARIPADELPKA